MSTDAEENVRAARTRTAREEAALEAAEAKDRIAAVAAEAERKRKAAEKKKAEAEKVGTGESSFDLAGALAKIQAEMDATTDPARKATLAARHAALKANQ